MTRLRFACLLLLAAFFTVPGPSRAQTAQLAPQAGAAVPGDPFVWLESVNSPQALDWVKSEDAKTLAVLKTDPPFATLYDDALKIVEAKDRIPSPTLIQSQVYNFWQDDAHVRGLWRHTTQASFASASPEWTTTLDLDALAKAENANWVWEGADCRWPDEVRCLISLSDGGEDAVTLREFDLASRSFVKDGFVLPRGKSRVEWESDDTLLVSRQWAPGELTTSGYPYIVKRLERGRPLSSAVEVFRGSREDGGYGVTPIRLHDAAGNDAMIIIRPLSTFDSEFYLLTKTGVEKMSVPLKSQAGALVAGRLLWTLQEDWTVGGTTFPQGSLVEMNLADAKADPQHLKPQVVYNPGLRETLDNVAQTNANLLLWLERRGVYVVANIRGGGEFGPAWHDAALDVHRQRAFDDFTAVAQALIADKVTSQRRLGIQGGSNGGLLMGVEFTQHPDLWRAVDIQVPLLDMLRFEQIQAGASWSGEYGSVSNPEQRAFLASISPYQNVKSGVKYPQALIWTTTKDDRVGPQHARKFAAKLSAMHVPYLFYEVTEGGHGAGANLQERAFTSALEMTYFVKKLMD